MILEFESGEKFQGPFELELRRRDTSNEELVQFRRAAEAEALMSCVIKVDLEFISLFYIRYKYHSVKLNYLWRRNMSISLFGDLDHVKMVRVYSNLDKD